MENIQSIETQFLSWGWGRVHKIFKLSMMQGMLNIKRVGQVEVDHNDRPVDDVMIKKGSVVMQ